MGSGHRDLDRLAGEARHHLELVHEAKVQALLYRTSADRRGMHHVRIVLRNRLRTRLALKGRNLLPEMIQHGVRRRVAVMPPTMHLAARDYVNSRVLLFEDRGLGG